MRLRGPEGSSALISESPLTLTRPNEIGRGINSTVISIQLLETFINKSLKLLAGQAKQISSPFYGDRQQDTTVTDY